MYGAVDLYARSLVGAFYRPHLHGGRIPPRGPLVVVTNHTNGLADGALMLLAADLPLRFLAKVALFEMPFVGSLVRGAGAVPIYRQKDGVDMSRNAEAFSAIHAALRDGAAIAIFPEGSSETVPRLRPLKTGAARMALGAEVAGDEPVGVRIVPVGLVYQRRDHWRSRVDICVGEPIEARDYLSRYAEDERGTVLALNGDIANGLRAAALELETLEDRLALGIAEELLPRDQRSVPDRLRSLASGLEQLRATAPERATELTARLEARGPVAPRPIGRLRAIAGTVAFGLALALAVAPWAPIAGALRTLALAKRPTVDKYVTTLLIGASVVFPLWFAGLVVVAALVLGAPAGLGVAAWLIAGGLLGARLWPHRGRVAEDWRSALDPNRPAERAAADRALAEAVGELDRGAAQPPG